jgi:hypothetical protein
VAADARVVVQEACADHPPLLEAVFQLLAHDGSQESVFRMIPFAVSAALTGDPAKALPVGSLSRLWWAGAETFDDLNDGKFDSRDAGLSSANATVASVVCITLLPQAAIGRGQFPTRTEYELTRELARASLSSANGQINDLSPIPGSYSWADTIGSYAEKSGAPYARDLAMIGHLAELDADALQGLRAFGRLFGVLRQLANDRATGSVEEDEDLINGTQTLLVAYAASVTSAAERTEFTSMQARARDDLRARRAFRERLHRADVVTGYNQRVDSIRRSMAKLLEQLAAPSSHRDLLGWMIDVSATAAKLPSPGSAG